MCPPFFPLFLFGHFHLCTDDGRVGSLRRSWAPCRDLALPLAPQKLLSWTCPVAPWMGRRREVRYRFERLLSLVLALILVKVSSLALGTEYMLSRQTALRARTAGVGYLSKQRTARSRREMKGNARAVASPRSPLWAAQRLTKQRAFMYSVTPNQTNIKPENLNPKPQHPNLKRQPPKA